MVIFKQYEGKDRVAEYLLLWLTEGTNEIEKLAWNSIKISENKEGTLFLEVNSVDEWNKEHIRLQEAGWYLQSTGSGALRKASTYKRNSAE